jgi:hypothetical protein
MTGARSRSYETSLVWAVVLLIGVSYYRGCFLAGDRFVSPQPAGYYGLLTQALLDGQLNLELAPDSRLLQLQNPYAGPQGTDRPHDMSFYRGKFYLYYGITPVLILLAPWRLLTGTYLTEPAAITTFSFCGTLLWALWLWRIKRRLFPGVASLWLVLAIAGLGWGSPVFLHCNDATFYLVPIAAAYACLAAVAVAVLQAAQSTRGGRAAAWLGLASLSYGLAVGARPNYVLGLPLLPGIALFFWRRVPPSDRWRWAGLRWWCAAIIPAAVAGLALAAYNYLRFDNPFEFGMRYSLASGDLRKVYLLGPEFIGKNLSLYLLHPAGFYRHFPFISTLQSPFGVLPHLPLAAVALLFPFTLLAGRLRRDPAWCAGGWFVLGATLANFLLLCCFFGGENRYLLDFVPPALALAGAVSFFLWGETTGLRPARWAYVAIAGWTLVNGVLLGLANRPGADRRVAMARAADTVVRWLERAAGTQYGSFLLDVRFPRRPAGTMDTLLVTGAMCGVYDAVEVHYLDHDDVQFGFVHLGDAGPVSAPIRLDRDRSHQLELHLGSLYPPSTYPLYAGLSPGYVERLRHAVEVRVDGRTVLNATVAFYPSSPGCVVLGVNPADGHRFGGEILRVARQEVLNFGQSPPRPGPIRLKLVFPAYRHGPGEPLLSTGRFGAGDLILVKFMQDGRVRLGHDCWNGGMVLSEAFAVDPDREYVLDVDFGALRDPASGGTNVLRTGPLRVRLDGETMLDLDRPFNPSTPEQVVAGYNLCGATSADSTFTGRIASLQNIPPWSDRGLNAGDGPIKLDVIFDADRPGATEPLFVSGNHGAADVVYVKYDDPSHIQIGLDHWGVGTVLSDPLPVDYRATHRIEIVPGVSGTGAGPTHAFHVVLNGKTVLTAPWPAYPAAPDDLAVGRNTVGASTCAPRFTGQIIAVSRLRPASS